MSPLVGVRDEILPDDVALVDSGYSARSSKGIALLAGSVRLIVGGNSSDKLL